MAKTVTDAVPIVAGVLLMIWNIALVPTVIWILWTRRKAAWYQLVALGNLKAWPNLRNIGMCSGVKDPIVRAKVETIADEQRLYRVRRLILPYCLAAIPIIAAIHTFTAYRLASGKDGIDYLVERGRVFFLVFVEALMVLFFLRPASMTRSTLRLGFASQLVRGVYVAFTEGGHGGALPGLEADYQFLVSHTWQLWGGLILQDSSFLLLAHVVLIPASIASRALQKKEDLALAAGLEIFFACLVCFASVTVERATKASIYSSLQAQNAQALEGAADAMLSTICDAVVHLTSSFRLTRPCPRLGALLLRDPRARMDENFCDLFQSAEDIEKFETFMKVSVGPSDGDGSLAHTMHTTLLDSSGIPVQVQLFHTLCIGAGTEERHLVGIREVSDERFVPMPPELPANAKEMAHVANAPCAGSLATISESTIWESDSDSGASLGLLGQDDTAKVWISICDSALVVLRWTPPFESIIGQSALSGGDDLIDLMPSSKEQEKAVKKLQFLSNSLLHDEDDAASADLRLLLQTQHRGVIRVEASVELDLDDEDMQEEVNMIIAFKTWHRVNAWHGKCANPKRRRASPSSASVKKRLLPNVETENQPQQREQEHDKRVVSL